MPLYSIDGKQMLFAHVPKAGGTTVEFALDAHCVGLLDRKFRGRFFPCSPQHFHAEILMAILDQSKISYAFMVVRHPVARLVSEYKWRKQHFGLTDGFSSWVENAIRKFKGHRFATDNHLRPMVEYRLPDCEVFKLEDGLDRVWSRLLEVFPTVIIAPNPRRKMASPPDDIFDPPAEEILALIRDTYAADFAAFGYE